MSKKIKSLLLFTFLFFLLAPIFVDSAARPLEVKYPPTPGVPPPATVETEVPIYIRYIFNFFIWTSGLIALGALVYGGIRYITSAGRPEALKDARDQILAALAGLLILFSSWLILTTINPQLTNFQLKKLPPVPPSLGAGVYLCKEEVNIREIWDNIQVIKNPGIPEAEREKLIKSTNELLETLKKECWPVPSQGEITPEFNDLAIEAWVVPSGNTLYGAILYEKSKFGGQAQVVYILDLEPAAFDVAIKPSSVRPFAFSEPRPEVYVELYEKIDFNRADSTKKTKHYGREVLLPPPPVSSYLNVSDFPQIGSVKIEGDLIVIFFKEPQVEDWAPSATIDVILQTDADLFNNPMGRWDWRWAWKLWEYYPRAKQMVIVSAGIY